MWLKCFFSFFLEIVPVGYWLEYFRYFHLAFFYTHYQKGHSAQSFETIYIKAKVKQPKNGQGTHATLCQAVPKICNHAGWQELAGFRRGQKRPSILSSNAYLLICDKKTSFFRVQPKTVIYRHICLLNHQNHLYLGIYTPYMQKTCDVAEKAILAKKNCGKSA